MTRSLTRHVLISLGAAIGGLLVGNLLFPPEPGQAALDALPFTLVGAFLVIWPVHRLLEYRIDRYVLRWAALVVIGTIVGGVLLGTVLAIAGVSQAKVLSLSLAGASYGGLTAIFWAMLHQIFRRFGAQ